MNAFAENFAWQERYIESAKRIIGPLLLKPADLKRDMLEATDLIVLTARDMRIGCRIRRAGFADKYPWQFTIRSRVVSGAKTELQKITEGWGEWLFYGHAEHNELPSLVRWFLVDLDSWRAHMIRSKDKIKHGVRANGDGTEFAWFDLRSFPASPDILVGSSHDWRAP